MTTSTLITDYVGRGTHAARPVTPNIPAGATALYYETDTGSSFAWSGSAWVAVGSTSLPSIASGDLLANATAGAAVAADTALTALIDRALGSTQGQILYRNATVWVPLAAGASGQVLTTGGASANPAWASPAVTRPLGRLTLTSGAPVMIADVTAATTIYYDSFIGNKVSVAGTNLSIGSNEISMGLDAVTPHVAANNVYDIFAINNSGTLALCVGPAWTSTATVTITNASPAVITWTGHGLAEGAPVVFTTTIALPTGITAGTTYFVGRSPATNTFNISTTIANAAAGTFVNTSSGGSGTQTGTNGTTARGTGAGTTELHLDSNGLWTNKNTLTHAWGGASGTTDYGPVSADAASYLGSLYATANGQTAMQFAPAAASGGSNAFLALYNAYNRVPVQTVSRDSTASWTYAINTWRGANGSAANRISWLDGLQQTMVNASYTSTASSSVAAAFGAEAGLNFDSTAAAPGGLVGDLSMAASGNGNAQVTGSGTTTLLGLHYAQAMERVRSAVSNTFFSNQTAYWATLSLAGRF